MKSVSKLSREQKNDRVTFQSWKQISLGNEVYRAPEYMYVLLQLPQLIVELTSGLPQDQLRECLSHIALTGQLITVVIQN